MFANTYRKVSLSYTINFTLLFVNRKQFSETVEPSSFTKILQGKRFIPIIGQKSDPWFYLYCYNLRSANKS